MRKLLVLPFLLLSLFSCGQNFEWVKHTKGNSYEQCRDILIDNEKNIYATGHFYQNADFDPGPINLTLSSSGGYDIYITKSDSTGNLIWAKQIGNSNDEYVANMISDSQDNLYLVGFFKGIVDFDPNAGVENTTSISNNYNTYLLKLDKHGNFIYVKLIENIGFNSTWLDPSPCIAIDSNGEIIIGGDFDTSFDADPGPSISMINTRSANQTYIIKFDNAGNYLWSGHFESTVAITTLYDLTIDNSNNIICLLQYYGGSVDIDPSLGTHMLNSLTNQNTTIIKINPSGSYLWSAELEGNCMGKCINQDLNGNLIIGGYFNHNQDFDPGPSDYFLNAYNTTDDIFILKLDQNGSFEWAKHMSGDEDEHVFSIALDSLNYIYVNGRFDGTIDLDPSLSNYPLTSNGAFDIFHAKLNENGQFIWAIKFGGIGYDYSYSMKLDNDLNIYSGGHFVGSVDFDPDTSSQILNSIGNEDIFLLKLSQDSCSTLSLSIDSVYNYNCLTNGYINSNASGGISPYNYLWNTNPPSFTQDISPDSIGIFQVILTDAIGCQLERDILISGPEFLSGFDLEVNLLNQDFRTGFTSNIWLNGFNSGCAPISGTLSCILDPLVNFNSSIPPPDLISGDTLFWNFTDLIYDSLHVTPVINVTTNGQIGDTVCFSVMIGPISGDADSSNNYKSYCFPVINGYDPNDKNVYPQGECIPNYVLKGEPLTYTVRFQNTGNADAINIHILDTLDADLDLNSLRVIGNSHYLITEILPGNVMKFRFDNIHLPDSGTNELLSHGYVIYEVKPLTGTPDYTLIENTSHIYFDFNPAIVTNTTENTLVDSIPTYSSIENISVCYDTDYTLPDGTIYSNIISPISHQSNLWMVDGCDSIITTNIAVLNPIDTSISLNGFTITSNASGLNYQWLDCSTGLPVGITTQSFTPTVNGIYSVVINDGNCTDTSNCIIINTIGINENQISGLNIYPNPTKNILTISQNSNSKLAIEILDIEGRLIQSFTSSEKNIQTDVSQFENGMYFINVKSETRNVVYKLVKE